MPRSKAQAPAPAASHDFIKPLIHMQGEKHVFEELHDVDPAEMPVLKSIGYAHMPGTQTWVSYVITTQGDKVLSIEVDEPNHRAIAEETTKINFVNQFMTQGL